MDTSRTKRLTKKSRKITFSDLLQSFGSLFWRIGLLGQLSLNLASLVNSIPRHVPSIISSDNSPALKFYDGALLVLTSDSWAKWSLICSITAVWWNPMFKQVNSGFMRHITGFSDWYKYQGILLVTRGLFYSVLGKGVMADGSSAAARTANTFLFGFVSIVSLLSLLHFLHIC